ncbi:MAG: FHA domain-containing protein, partial [Dokdonella sp.]
MNFPLELERIEGPSLGAGRWRIAHPFRIGRAEGNELELSEPSISRRHVSIESDAQGWLLRDCGSLLGSRLNELPIAAGSAVALRAGDVIGIGPWRFRVNAVVASTAEVESVDSLAQISLVRAVGSLAEQRLELLLRYAGELSAAPDAQVLAEIVAEHALLGSGYSRAAVIWRDGEQYRVRCRRPVPMPGALPWRFNASLLHSARNGEIARLDIGASADGTSKLRRALCAPLMLDGYAQAFLYLDADRPAARRNADAPSFCHALARLGALALANLHRLDSERERASLWADLERARDVQNRLLPA